MIKVFKSEIERLETTVTSAKRDLDKVASQHEAAVIRAAELADQVASAFADAAENADSLEQQHFQAELRVKSLKTAVERATKRHTIAQHELAEAKKQAKAEATATKCRDLASAIERAKPAAAKSSRVVADLWGSAPVNIGWPPAVLEWVTHWLGCAEFFENDFLDLAAKALRMHADSVQAGEISSDLGPSFDDHAERFGRKPMGLKKAS